MNKETEKATWDGAFNALGKMWGRMRANPEPAVVLVVVYLIVVLLETTIVGTDQLTMRSAMKVAGFEAAIFLAFLLALPTYALALAKGKPISVREFLRFDGKKYLAILGATILYSLAVTGALLLFIIPAIWVIAWFSLYQMLIIDKNLGSVAALKESKRLIGNHKSKVWGIIGASVLLSIGASLLGVLPLVGDALSSIASIITTVLTTASLALLYRWAR